MKSYNLLIFKPLFCCVTRVLYNSALSLVQFILISHEDAGQFPTIYQNFTLFQKSSMTRPLFIIQAIPMIIFPSTILTPNHPLTRPPHYITTHPFIVFPFPFPLAFFFCLVFLNPSISLIHSVASC